VRRPRAWRGTIAACPTSPAPVGYDPRIIPQWAGGPASDAFAGLRLTPWRVRLMPGTVMLGGGGEVLTWTAPPG
jgi:hypothetical protein